MSTVIDAAMPYRLLEEATGSSSEGESSPVDAVLFVGMSLVLGIASRHLLRGTRVPYTVALLVIGIALGSLGSISILPLVFTLAISYFIMKFEKTRGVVSSPMAVKVNTSKLVWSQFWFWLFSEYGTHHNLGKLGHGIRICKLLILTQWWALLFNFSFTYYLQGTRLILNCF